jgi:hypothetical protein
MLRFRRALTGLLLLLLLPSLSLAAGVTAVFDVTSPANGPFPSDRYTVPDATHNTGLLVNLPKPNCAARPSDCADIDVINTLDGFNVQPRLTVAFSGPIDLASVDSSSVFLVSLGNALGGGGGAVVGINQVVWEPTTNTLYAESDALLDQHTRYALVVTNAVKDAAGDPVEAGAFATFRHDLDFGQTHDPILKDYRKSLLDALQDLAVPESSIVTMSVFSTQSVTAVLEKIRDQIKASTPAPADFFLAGPATPTVFPVSTVAGIVWNQQRTIGPALTSAAVPAAAALNLVPGVGKVAFGRFSSPDYEMPGKFIPAIGTLTGVPIAQATNTLYFNLFLPAGTMPATGWPVAIFGHGFGDSKNNSPFVVAEVMAQQGIATIAIDVVGHGRGPNSTLTIQRTASNGGNITFPTGGRGIDQNGDGNIDTTEGSGAAPPRGIISSRDGLRQTVVDLMQLTRLIETGGISDLDPSRIYYFGQSFGGIYGTIFLGVEPSVRLGVPNVAGGSVIEIVRLGTFRPLLGGALLTRVPSLYNAVPNPLLTSFVDNIPLRDQPPATNTVPGTDLIQELVDNSEWVQQAGNPAAYAPYLRKEPLPGMPAKHVIFQFAKGDQTVPNPTTTAILRAGDLADRATFYRNDLAFAANGAIPKNPHTFMTGVLSTVGGGIARDAQLQIATFFASETTPGTTPTVLDPDPSPIPNPAAPAGPPLLVNVFEVPIVPPLPEGLSFIP